MTITNGYATLAELKAELGINDTDDDEALETAIEAASRQCDDYTGRRFWQDAAVVARVYEPEDPYCLYVDDISTATGLVVKIDADGSGTYETTLTLGTDFRLEPANAAAEYPVRPYTELEIIRSRSAYYWPTGYDDVTVQVTAKFGWSAVPEQVAKACRIQALQLFKAKDAVFGALAMGDGTTLRVKSSLNPMAEALLAAYRKPSVG